MADKRDIRRIKKRISIRFGIDEPVRVAYTEDISMIGMFIRSPYIIPPNSKIKVEIVLPGGTVVELEARVMWAKKVPPNLFHLVKKSGMGVRFLHFHAGEDAYDNFFENIATPHLSVAGETQPCVEKFL
ncbi:MAG: PilZ domain-containing protein [Desulfuromonadaceae bacterium]|nr:PilZ domain-containing protein [Desulfuromonadaceae bacterium]